MAIKIEWQPCDYAARDVLGSLIRESGLSLRAFAEAAESEISFARVRDIRDGERAPVRLSEFLAICRVCGKDPVTILREIMERAQIIEAAAAAEEGETVTVDGLEIPVLELVAKRGDIDAEQENYVEEP